MHAPFIQYCRTGTIHTILLKCMSEISVVYIKTQVLNGLVTIQGVLKGSRRDSQLLLQAIAVSGRSKECGQKALFGSLCCKKLMGS